MTCMWLGHRYEFLPVPKALAAWQTWRDVRNAYTVDGESDMDEPITVRASDEVRISTCLVTLLTGTLWHHSRGIASS